MKRLFRNSYGAMLWKEVHENAVWAALAALVLIGMNYLFGGDFAFKNSAYDATDVLTRFMDNSVEPVITLGVGPVLATILGIMQVLPEKRRDQWAFLIHRPLSHTALFWHKAAAGLFLYTVSLGGALLLLWYLKWMPIRQHFPDVPFDWRFMLGGIANLLLGVPFYFAAMLCVMRHARWYGSRLVPLLGCLVLHYFWFQLQEFYQCFWLVVLYSVVYAVAVRNSFAESGQAPLRGKIGRFATGVALLTGLAPLLGGGLLFLNMWASIAFPESEVSTALSREPRITSSYYVLLDDGEVARAVMWSNSKTRYFRVDGKEQKSVPRKLPILSDRVFTKADKSFRRTGRYLEFIHRYYDTYRHAPYLGFYSAKLGRILLFTDSWRFVGFADVTGAPANSPMSRELLLADIGGGYVWLSDGIYRFTGHEMALQQISNARDIEGMIILSIPRSERKTKLETAPNRTSYLPPLQLLIVLRSKSIDFFDISNKLLFSTPREHNGKFYSQVGTQTNRERTRYYIAYKRNWLIPELKGREMPDYIVALDDKGTVLKRYTFPPLPLSVNASVLNLREAAGLGMGIPPIAWAGFTIYSFNHYASYQLAPSLWLKQIMLNLPGFFFMVVFSLICALICCGILWLLRKRSGLTTRSLRIWLLIVFTLGPIGLLLFLTMRGWPARVPCSNCGNLRAVDFNNCERCGAAWPVRVKDDTEILVEKPEVAI